MNFAFAPQWWQRDSIVTKLRMSNSNMEQDVSHQLPWRVCNVFFFTVRFKYTNLDFIITEPFANCKWTFVLAHLIHRSSLVHIIPFFEFLLSYFFFCILFWLCNMKSLVKWIANVLFWSFGARFKKKNEYKGFIIEMSLFHSIAGERTSKWHAWVSH